MSRRRYSHDSTTTFLSTIKELNVHGFQENELFQVVEETAGNFIPIGVMWGWLLLLIVTPLLYVIGQLLRIAARPFWPSPIHKIPGPAPTSWLNGNVPEILSEEAMVPMMQWTEQYSDSPLILYRMFGNTDRVLLVDPDAVMQAMHQKNLLSKDLPSYSVISKFIGNGLVSLLGQQHAEHRRMIQPAFRLQYLKAMVPTFVSQTKLLCELWRQRAGEDIAVSEDLSKLTLNIIGMSAFGFDFDSLSEKASVGKDATRHFTGILEGTESGTKRIFVFLFPWILDLPVPVFPALQRDLKYFDNLVTAIIREKRIQLADVDPETQQFSNLLEILLTSQESRALTDSQLSEHVKTLLFAGHETTATLVLWTLFALSQEPEISERLKEDLDALVKSEDAITYDTIEEATYLNAVIKEVLRMYPPVAIVIRKFEEDFHFKGQMVPAGASAAISPYVLHHSPKLWDEPERFNPDRWLGKTNHHKYQFLPFLKGSRNCIGEKFAMLEASVILAIVLKEFRVEMDPQAWKQSRRGLNITMRPKPSPVMRLVPWE